MVNVTPAAALIGDSGCVATWTARTRLPGQPEAVLAVLTDPDAIARWAPVGFELVDYEGRRLIAGDRVRRVAALGECSELQASVTVSGNGLRGRFLARATETLLAAGALSTAVGRIAEQLARANTASVPRAIAA